MLSVLVLFQAFLSPLAGVTFASAAESDQDKTKSGNINLSFDHLLYDSKKITNEADADGIRPKMDENVELHYKFTTTDIWLPGDHFKFKLPQQILIYDKKQLSGIGKIKGVEYFKYETDDATREVTVTFTKMVDADLENGHIYFGAKFGNFGGNTSTIKYLKSHKSVMASFDLPLTFLPKNQGASSSKSGTVSKDGNSIDWEVWYNLDAKTLGSTDTHKIEDSWPAGDLELVNGSVKLVTATVTSTIEGATVDGTPKDVTIPAANIVATNAGFTITDIQNQNQAYKLTYSTKVTRTADEEFEKFKNNVQVKKGTETTATFNPSAEVQIEYGKPLAKRMVSGDKYKANWEINFNYLGQNAPDKTTITDTVTGPHSIDYATLIVKSDGATLAKGTDYTITEEAKTFTITLNNPGTKAYDVTYSTIADVEFFTADATVENKVTTSLKDTTNVPYKAETVLPIYEGVGAKSIVKTDYAAKTLTWKLVANPEGKTVKNLEITDAFTGDLKLMENTLTVVSGGLTASDYDFKPNVEGKGFTLMIKKDITSPVVFTYQSTYDNDDKFGDHNGAIYKNNASFKWDGVHEDSKGFTVTKSVPFTPSTVSKNNSKKTGKYNYATKEFEWTVDVNFNKNTIKKAVITDKLGDGQKLVDPSSVKVYEATPSSGTEVTRGAEVAPGSNTWSIVESADGFVLTFNKEIKEAYQITYKSIDADDLIDRDADKGHYTNTVNITEGPTGPNVGSSSATVEVSFADEMITKTPRANKEDSTVEWEVYINRSQSNITNVKFEDIPGIGTDDVKHWLIKDSVKITPVTIGDKDSMTIDTTTDLPGTVYTANGFEITNLKPNQAYKVTYTTYYDGPSQGQYKNTAKLTYTANGTGHTSSNGKDTWEYAENYSGASADFKRFDLNINKIGVNKDRKDGVDKNAAEAVTAPLKGVKFELWNKTGKIKLREETSTDENGIATFAGVGYGIYQLKEISTIPGYKPMTANMTLTLTKDKVTITDGKVNVDVENNKIMQSVELRKMDKSNKPLKDALFTLHKANGEQVVVNTKNTTIGETITVDGVSVTNVLTTDGEGEIYIPYLEANVAYYFKEISAPGGYLLPTGENSKKTFTIVENAIEKQSVSKQNDPIKLTITNVEGDPKDGVEPQPNDPKIEGSTFEIFKITGSCPVKGSEITETYTPIVKYSDGTAINLTTDTNGKIEIDFSKLGVGQYVIVQKQVNNYYENREHIVVDCVDITTTKKEVPPTIFENERVSTVADLTLRKTSTTVGDVKRN